MATETTDYAAALDYLERAKRRDCALATPELPDPHGHLETLRNSIPYLDLGLTADYQGEPHSSRFQAFASGWTDLEGVMLVTPEVEFDADLRVAVAAENERALRDLLLAFPAGKVGFFYYGTAWMQPILDELFEGHILPSREGLVATEHSFTPRTDYPARRLQPGDYSLVQGQWSETTWNEVLAQGYTVHACEADGELAGLCFHWQVAPWRNEVHGLQAVRDFSGPYSASVVSSATAEVIAEGKLATCTANLSSEEEYLGAFAQVGYERFYRVRSFLGVKRGSGGRIELPTRAFFYPTSPRKMQHAEARTLGVGREIQKSKDPILAQFSALAHAGGRRERSQFVVEDLTLVQRALRDGLPVDHLLYTPDLLRTPDGVQLLQIARQAGIDHSRVTEGLMGRVTTTRPVPTVIGAVFMRLRAAQQLKTGDAATLLIAEDINNPDNLGMLLRTADAAGVEGVIVAGERSDPFQKQCIRAARGAVGRLPILSCQSLERYLPQLAQSGFTVAGAALQAKHHLYDCTLAPPIAVIVGNEQHGIRPQTLDVCTLRLRIPMAPGQDSLNVGVAAGVLLYEVNRWKTLNAGR